MMRSISTDPVVSADVDQLYALPMCLPPYLAAMSSNTPLMPLSIGYSYSIQDYYLSGTSVPRHLMAASATEDVASGLLQTTI